jgi:hypothetical protein
MEGCHEAGWLCQSVLYHVHDIFLHVLRRQGVAVDILIINRQVVQHEFCQHVTVTCAATNPDFAARVAARAFLYRHADSTCTERFLTVQFQILRAWHVHVAFDYVCPLVY